MLTELQKYQEKNDSCSCTGRPEGTEAFSWRNSDEKTKDGGEKITEIRGMPRKENHIWQLCNFLRSLNGANHSCSPVMVNTMTANIPILIKAPLQGFVWHPRLRHDFAPGAIPKVINFITFISKWRGKAFWCPGTSSRQLSSKYQGKNKQPGMENSDLLRIIANKGHRHRPPEFVHLQPGWEQRGKDHPETQTRLSTETTNKPWGGCEDRGVQQGCEEWGGQRRG